MHFLVSVSTYFRGQVRNTYISVTVFKSHSLWNLICFHAEVGLQQAKQMSCDMLASRRKFLLYFSFQGNLMMKIHTFSDELFAVLRTSLTLI